MIKKHQNICKIPSLSNPKQDSKALAIAHYLIIIETTCECDFFSSTSSSRINFSAKLFNLTLHMMFIFMAKFLLNFGRYAYLNIDYTTVLYSTACNILFITYVMHSAFPYWQSKCVRIRNIVPHAACI